MADKFWGSVSIKSPCRICGKPDWCSASRRGAIAICRRLDTGEGIHRVDRIGVDYWVYNLGGRTAEDIESPPPLDDHKAEKADPDTLSIVYSELLLLLALSPVHRINLRQRGLTDDAIRRHGYKTLPLLGRAKLAKQLVERFGSVICSTVPGLYLKSNGSYRDTHWSLAGSPGILIPVFDIQGKITALKIRRDG